MIKEKEIIVSNPGDEQEPILVPQYNVKAELIYALVIIILMSLIMLGGATIHPRSNYNIEKNIKY